MIIWQDELQHGPRTLIFTIPAPDLRPVKRRSTGKLTRTNPWINSNDRRHRMVVANLTSAWRATAKTECERVAAGLRLIPPVHIEARIHKTHSGRWDPNNLNPTTKAIVDGLVEAGLIPDDSWREVLGPDHRRGDPGPDAVTLTITEITE